MPRTLHPAGKAAQKKPSREATSADAALALFHPVTATWFLETFQQPTAPQIEGWPAIARGESTLILAPTGTGKTLTAFLWCLDKLMLRTPIDEERRCRVLYISPLKALAVDVERNLRRPLRGIANTAEREGAVFRMPEISVRTGDTAAKERAHFRRHPGDILITTPESLYLLLTSGAGESLRTVETIIIDEIHALVPTKRGAHLALSLERLEALAERRLQRIGLSATQRPLEEVARFLGGAEAATSSSQNKTTHAAEIDAEESSVLREIAGDETEEHAEPPCFRPVTIVNAGARKELDLKVEVPVESMAVLKNASGSTQEPKRSSIWQTVPPRLLELIRARTSTLIFVNARRLAERMAGAINELAGEPVARAHHGSLAAAQRTEIEELLKAGEIRALVATSSLELGIDMGAIDLVVQIESPPSVASGMQRIGRAGHHVGAPSSGIIFPKYRTDLIPCAAVTRAMHEGHVEATRYLRNPLDVLAQQIVAVIAHPPHIEALQDRNESGTGIDYVELLRLVRRATPFASLSQSVFNGVLDMLAGRYPSDEFAELKPRITWDRKRGWLMPRSGVKHIAILNGGTIPDRGLYGVFLAGEHAKPVRVGELDEEMVFETRVGETFILGASTWRVEEVTHDRVLVSPAPGAPGKMPFWHGDLAGRPIEFGRRIGAFVRESMEVPQSVAMTRLMQEHDLEQTAAEDVLRLLADQALATTVIPNDRNIVIERVRDELGGWRMCVLTPFGSRIHAPWAMAATAKVRSGDGKDVEAMWSEDGFVLRFPETEEAPWIEPVLLSPEEAAEFVLSELGSTALFAAKFRESAARALLLPRRRATGRIPLWHQRKRSYDLLSVASRYASFPILLEAYRECLRDIFDMPALMETMRSIRSGSLRVHTVDSQTPSPFAAALLFSYVANYIYDGDAPLAERRAQALSIDQDQLRELMGDADLREILDLHAMEEIEEQLQGRAEDYRARTADGVHDLLLRTGDLNQQELRARCVSQEVAESITSLLRVHRVLAVTIAGEERWIAAEDAARYRDALDVPLPHGLPDAFLESVSDALLDLLRRYARTHGPFTTAEITERFSLRSAPVETTLNRLVQMGRVVEGGFRPGGMHREWCDHEVLRSIRRRSLARLRKQIEPVEQRTLARLITRWQGVVQPRRGLDALLDVIENLQGAPLPASILETEILPARILRYQPSDLDTLIAAGEVVWCGLEPLGEHDGRVGLYLADKLEELYPISLSALTQEQDFTEREKQVIAYLRQQGASFFSDLHLGVGSGYPGETLDALWSLVWKGLLRNDSLAALRAYCERSQAEGRSRPKRVHRQTGFRSRRTTPPTAQGRWSLQSVAFEKNRSVTAWSHAMAQQLLTRYGVVFRETAHAENLPGGFSAIYDVMKMLEESGRVRRGYFAADLGATQFAMPAAVDLLRSLRVKPQEDRMEMVQLAATDPANPYGALFRWPAPAETSSSLTRSVGARVVLADGELMAYLRRGNPNLQLFLPEEEPQRSRVATSLAEFFIQRAREQQAEGDRSGMLIGNVNGIPVAQHPFAQFLLDAGFHAASRGFHVRRA